MRLSPHQKRFFYEEGYLVLRGVLPRVMVEAARQAINHSLGYEGMNKEDLPAFRSRSYCPEIQKDPLITALANRSPVFPIAESLMGEGNVQPVGAGQIALRFPAPPFTSPPEPHGHLDGLGTGINGLERGTYSRSFTALVVCYLAPVPEPYSGNFTVWPKSHRFFEQYFRENGHEVLANGMPRVELPEGPVQITGDAGDVVIAHHLLVHGAAPNASPNIRYAAIFRLRHRDCAQIGYEAYTDIWREWPGIREVIESA
ncbi:MAG: hypothetical protein KatS3mg115_1263 [Candidatus Poribacteria bacterium]|nr:MAG: hypothetical protein KatS3mg115_1263 [Candidatus Poribacteria bacterium]